MMDVTVVATWECEVTLLTNDSLAYKLIDTDELMATLQLSSIAPAFIPYAVQGAKFALVFGVVLSDKGTSPVMFPIFQAPSAFVKASPLE